MQAGDGGEISPGAGAVCRFPLFMRGDMPAVRRFAQWLFAICEHIPSASDAGAQRHKV